MQVVKVVLVQLLSDGDYQYQDMRVVTALLRVHMVLCSAPQSSVVSHATPEVRGREGPICCDVHVLKHNIPPIVAN